MICKLKVSKKPKDCKKGSSFTPDPFSDVTSDARCQVQKVSTNNLAKETCRNEPTFFKQPFYFFRNQIIILEV